jgi:peroxiredoxin
MVLTPSTMAGLGAMAPDFDLPDVVSGARVSRAAVARDGGLLVMFICRHCPYVKHVEGGLALLGRDFAESRIGIVAISSNDATSHPDDAPERLREQATHAGFAFPYLYDETQEVAKAYRAACTPDFFLHDAALRLVYRGQLDDSRPGNGRPVTGRDLRAAMEALLAGSPMPPNQRASIGCNIKWKPGNAPA